MAYVTDLGYAFAVHGRGHGREGTLVQTDWDYPSTARDLGWSLLRVQRRGKVVRHMARMPNRGCMHSGTDGTVKCPDCGIEAGDFIAAAAEFLRKIARY